MRGLTFHQRPRTLGAQCARMSARWPELEYRDFRGDFVSWRGPLRGLQKQHVVEAFWDSTSPEKPYVVVRAPTLRPREGMTFEQIPHLMFYSKEPTFSGLCLFDPDGQEWSNKLLIADTTIVWAAEWLQYYELWHVDGIWRGGGIGFESIAEARATAIHREADKLAQNPPPPAALAS